MPPEGRLRGTASGPALVMRYILSRCLNVVRWHEMQGDRRGEKDRHVEVKDPLEPQGRLERGDQDCHGASRHRLKRGGRGSQSLIIADTPLAIVGYLEIDGVAGQRLAGARNKFP